MKFLDGVGLAYLIDKLKSKFSNLENQITILKNRLEFKRGDSLRNCISIEKDTNLNDILNAGFYQQVLNANALADLNYPIKYGGFLTVYNLNNTNVYIVQEYTTLLGKKYIRYKYGNNNSFSDWKEIY